MNKWPVWATERIEVHPPDPRWQQRGEHAAELLDAALADRLVAPVQHVGSTAVSGLPAKPILDLQAAVGDLDCAPDIAAVLAPQGWHYVPPELDGRPWRRFFVRVAAGHRVAHLHLMLVDSGRWAEQLAFRDALRADPGLARRYVALKQSLAVAHAGDREAYTNGKTEFIRAVLQKRAPAT